MSRAKSGGKHLFLSDATARWWAWTHGHILAALRSLRQTPPVVPPVADGPGVSL